MRKIILDTDPGVGIPGTDADDPIALLLALADPRLDLLGVTTVFGNCPPHIGARGAKAILEATGRPDVPVRVGAARRLNGDLPAELVAHYAGDRGRAGRISLPDLSPDDTSQHAAEFIIEQVRAFPEEVTIVAIGPQTNIALALQLCPDLARTVDSIVFMGGAIGLDPTYGRGNVTPVAECNIWYDPRAADIVLRSGIPLTMVSLDVTNPNKGMVLAAESVQALSRSNGPAEKILAEVCATYLDAPMFDWGHGCVLYDPLAVAVAANPGLGVFEAMSLAVELTGGLTTGQTVPVRDDAPNVHVMVDVDGPSVVDEIVRTIVALDAASSGAKEEQNA